VKVLKFRVVTDALLSLEGAVTLSFSLKAILKLLLLLFGILVFLIL
jgi:hypothetical protein